MLRLTRTFAASAFVLTLAGHAAAEVSDEQALRAFRGPAFLQALENKSTLAAACEQELKAGAYGSGCVSYRAAALEALSFEQRTLEWCHAKIGRQVAAAGGRTDIKVNVPPVCSEPSAFDDRDQRIAALTGALNPAGAALAQQITAESKVAR